ncbi:tryptophan aminotransferase-related protein 1-like [Salvia miltiorrhiza]|uniref:tryptophan aminotransferase-related protein 1-like n=1 Tax=Salvia miltiorrhiza TaxID=226208 RepID=UPI0025AC63C0|nr:tryptophan aminotransferase-related protein 1-like [Salvia miltiorrhiza]
MCGTFEVLVTKTSKTTSSDLQTADNSNGHLRPNGVAPHHHHPQPLVSLDHGDPTMYESYWEKVGQKCSVTMSGFQSLSYFGNGKTLCWFMEQKLEDEIRKLHKVAGNAVVEGRHIVVGTGSSQLILAALYALADTLNLPNPVDVVSAAPYYSSYPEMIEFLRTGLFKWSGDARCFNKDVPYIEFVTSPNNPDGSTREAAVNRGELGMLVHDLAYYWPQYTAITSPADHDLMLFTASKCTGHAGSRIGWAIVRDENVARKMVKFIEMNTIGVSKEAQLRSASVMELISLSCTQKRKPCDVDNFFEYSQRAMAERWKRLREVVDGSSNQLFSLPKFPAQYCNFTREVAQTYPAFAWMKCKEGIDGEQLLREHKIGTRSGRRFGCDAEYVRISMLSRDDDFDLFLHRLSTIQPTANGN